MPHPRTLLLACCCARPAAALRPASSSLCDVTAGRACTPPDGTKELKKFKSVGSAADCCQQCEAFSGCTGWSWRQAKKKSHDHPCWLYADCSATHADEHYACGSGAAAPTPSPAPGPAPPTPPAPTPPPSPPPPMPTKGQLGYILDEIVALTHFNMRTFLGYNVKCNKDNWLSGVKSGDVATFAPSELNALGVKSAVLTFKHDCGFLLFDTNTSLPDGTRFKTKEKKPLQGQVPVTDEQYCDGSARPFAVHTAEAPPRVSLLLAQLREIWCGMGPMHEL
eukprot:gene9617-4247_t